MRVVHTEAELAAARGGVLVPTMGALHAGHFALVRRAAMEGRPVVVSVFVNPTQFAPGEDFERYPRRLAEDAEAATEAGADIVFAPEIETMYPPDAPAAVPPLPAVATTPGLEGAFRPGHFAGVCQVVARLFDLLRPQRAVFGEKDYQQLLVIRDMAAAAADRWGDLVIVSQDTVREPDGLAMSSRNAYLDADGRRRARGISRALHAAHGAAHPGTAERVMLETLAAHDLAVQYAVVRDASTLMPVTSFESPTRALIAARVGDVRLIDNRAM